jgi:thymidylate synthase ThyX
MAKVVFVNNKDITKEMELAGWMASVSYDSKGDTEKIAKHCINGGHDTPTRPMRFVFEISEVSRACYDKDTEILTPHGWKLFKDVNKGEEVATLNPVTKETEFQRINETINYKYKGNLHHYSNQAVDLLVTPNHNMYYKKYDTRVESDFSLCPSEDIHVKRFYLNKEFNINMYVKDRIFINGYSYSRKANNGSVYEKETGDLMLDRENFLKLFAWYLSDGSVYYNEKENSHTITIAQHDIAENIEKRAIMCDIISSLGFTPSKDSNGVKFKNNTLGRFLKELGKSSEKHIPFNLFLLFNKGYASSFINSYLMCDGHTTKDEHKYLYTTSKILADQLQLICNIAGYTSNIWIDDRTGTHEIAGNIVNRNFPLYTISLSNGVRNVYPVIKKEEHFSEVPYDDFVYCVEVPNHIIFVRRNGKSIWCGNCSHEFVRHEIGVGKVQRSQRYVDEDGFRYVTPKGLMDILVQVHIPINYYEDGIVSTGGEVTTWLSFYEFQQIIEQMYNGFVKYGVKNEDARYVLSNATFTKLHVAFDWEGLKQFCYRRLCNRAQWEIREVAEEIKRQVTEAYPFLGEKLGCHCDIHGYCPEAKGCGKAPNKDEFLECYIMGKSYLDSLKGKRII